MNCGIVKPWVKDVKKYFGGICYFEQLLNTILVDKNKGGKPLFLLGVVHVQIDLHHTAIYVLCRIAGMKSEFSEIVAHSSQYVDDAVYEDAIKFKNGGFFKQTQTAHKLLSPRDFNVNETLDIWMPFHFVPRADKGDLDVMVTAPNSKVLALLLEDIRSSSSENVLYRLGIGLHCFADAFSHQDFKGTYDPDNDVQLMFGVEEMSCKENAVRLPMKLLDRMYSDSMALGHGKVLNNPDIPYAQWGYSRRGKTIKVNNLEDRYLPGVKNIYEYLVYFLAKNPQYGSNSLIKPFDDYREQFHTLLSFKGSREERHINWLKAIKENSFDFIDFDEIDTTLSYDEHDWFINAVEANKVSKTKNVQYQRYDFHSFRKKGGFEDSHWVKFMQAAAEHRFLILHCLLPELGIIVG